MKTGILAAVVFFGIALPASAQEISGTVRDSLGAVIPKAQIELRDAHEAISSTVSDDLGRYRLTVKTAGRYRVRASAPTFAVASSDACYAGPDHNETVDLTLFPPAIAQEVVVTATGTPIPETQTGASVSVVDEAALAQKQEMQDTLRLLPGAQVAQTGQVGAASYLFVRGGAIDDNKVLIDGIPANDIGGQVDFSTLAGSGIEKVEVLRGPNSALFGADSLASVVDIRTRRGTTALPQLEYSADGGNFGTYRQDANVGGAWRRFDYFSDFNRFDTRNSEPNSQFHNETYAGNFGANLLPNTDVRVTVRRSVSLFNSANELDAYGIPDDANNLSANLYLGATLESRTTERWHNLLRYGATRLRYLYTDPEAAGIPYDPFDTGTPMAYLGLPLTITGANGYSATGQAILSYPGTYPSTSANLTNRDFVYAQSDYTLNQHFALLGGFRYEDERGYTLYTGSPKSQVEHGNYSYLMQIQGSFWSRAYYSLGSSIEDNEVFGVEGAPRASLAYYLVRPGSAGALSGTRLKFNFGKGVKEPSIYDETNSLYDLLKAQPSGDALIRQYGISPVGAQRSRSYDGGVEQQFLGGHGRFGLTYFHNEFGNQIEYIAGQFLPEFGIPLAAVDLAAAYGATANSLAYRAQGTETEVEYRWRHLGLRGGWTYLDAVVQRSLASSANANAIPCQLNQSPIGLCVFNPDIPNVNIGAYSPLPGARPFRRAPNSGSAAVDWTGGRWLVSLSGNFVSRRDDSTYLLDANYGNTMLLPNRNLLAAYQRLDLAASYRVNSVLSLTASAQNLLSQHYEEAFGYPTLPFTFRSGVKLTFGGESWHRKQ
jgi:iron complex outermembrane receptor protein/vitamin B12 transporter